MPPVPVQLRAKNPAVIAANLPSRLAKRSGRPGRGSTAAWHARIIANTVPFGAELTHVGDDGARGRIERAVVEEKAAMIARQHDELALARRRFATPISASSL